MVPLLYASANDTQPPGTSPPPPFPSPKIPGWVHSHMGSRLDWHGNWQRTSLALSGPGPMRELSSHQTQWKKKEMPGTCGTTRLAVATIHSD